jgi:hypothetical protein
LERVLNIIEREVKIAPGMDANRTIYRLPKLFNLSGDNLRLEFEFMIGVRTGYDIGSSVFHGHPKHFDRLFQRFGAIIQTRQDVAVDIYKIQMNISSSCVA